MENHTLAQQHRKEFDSMADTKSKKQTKYIVTQDFKDLEDKNKVYTKGDVYPNPANKKVDKKRIDLLLSSKNKQGRPVIKEVTEDQE